MMNKQSTNNILMIEPVSFGFNTQTAVNNYFQQQDDRLAEDIQRQALAEFSNMVKTFTEKDVRVVVIKDTPEPYTPDSIFPNNWISFHDDGRVALYPMFAENRRLERRRDIFEAIKGKEFDNNCLIDYSIYEKQSKFLEGTGSMVLDRVNKIAYAALSERTDAELFNRFCQDFGYIPVAFHAYQDVDGQRMPIYHTNVMMCVADRFAIVCTDTIDDKEELNSINLSLLKTGKEIIDITEEQMHQFAGNMLQVCSIDKTFLVMSQSAYDSLRKDQIDRIKRYNAILSLPIPTIEKYGGGSVRCMIAEIF